MEIHCREKSCEIQLQVREQIIPEWHVEIGSKVDVVVPGIIKVGDEALWIRRYCETMPNAGDFIPISFIIDVKAGQIDASGVEVTAAGHGIPLGSWNIPTWD